MDWLSWLPLNETTGALNSGSWSSWGRGSAPQRPEQAPGGFSGGGEEGTERNVFELLDF